ncbi:MAG: TrkH family potassium uptake protein [Candidatus Delongbacteria bacterium]|nr:TrkH family potassium uptake protein [Candidatus Delongbacteria bacterium]MBN2835920.1 TrkH family potassium uptake protein [Candidatus Delongbacteria bacterium]
MSQLHLRLVINVLGFLLLILGVSQSVPLFVSFFYNDHAYTGILESMLILTVTGLLMYKFTKSDDELSSRDGFIIVTIGWILMSISGAFPYYFSHTINSFTDCVFESTSGFTTTGASILTDIEILPKSIIFWRAMTHWIGGMGIVVFAIAISPFLGIGGMQLFKAEVPGPTTDKLTPRISQTAKILWMIYVGITVSEIIFLLFGGMSFFDSVCHAFATVATGGFSSKNNSIAFYQSQYIDYVISFFMIISGINFSLHYKLITGNLKSYLNDTELKSFILMIVIVTSVVTISNYSESIYTSFSESFRYSLFQVSSLVTTTGFATADYEQWTPLSQVLLFGLLFVGGSSGSTSGGIKNIRIVVAFKYMLLEAKKILHPNAIIQLRVNNCTVNSAIVHSILSFVVLFFFIFIILTILMTLAGVDIITSLSSVITCLSGVGPGFGLVGPTENFAMIPLLGKIILSFSMIIGRLEIHTFFIILTSSFWKN